MSRQRTNSLLRPSPLTSSSPTLPLSPPPTERPILSQADCQAILARVTRTKQGDRDVTAIRTWSDWIGGVRWGRNQILSTQSSAESNVNVGCWLNGKGSGWVVTNEVTEEALAAVASRAKRMLGGNPESYWGDLQLHRPLETPPVPALFDDATYQQPDEQRVAAAAQLIQHAVDAGMYSAGYLEVSAHSLAILDTMGRIAYFRYTWAQCSVTVRDPAGTGSGWAGVDWPAWSKIDAAQLGKTALDKCLRSRNPVRVEPGRYTTILEPQAVFDLLNPIFGDQGPLDREQNELPRPVPFLKQPGGLGYSKLGDRVADSRVTISVDPMDPELGCPPFMNMELPNEDYRFYYPLTFVKDGVLTELPYDQRYGALRLGRSSSRAHSGAFRMSGGTTSIAEMIASTTRGILVTRLSDVQLLSPATGLVRAYTRDGTWLIENGAISKPIVNLAVTESSLFALNNLDQLGVPQRIFNPPYRWRGLFCAERPSPAIVPPIKVHDFSFTALVDAV